MFSNLYELHFVNFRGSGLVKTIASVVKILQKALCSSKIIGSRWKYICNADPGETRGCSTHTSVID